MQRSIALLRGVNVGGHNPVPMEVLRDTLTLAGFSDVSTYIQSGNIGLSAPGPVTSERIQTLIRHRFGLTVPVVVLSPAELESIVMRNPFAGDVADLGRLHVFFLSEVPEPGRIERLDPASCAPDRFALEGRALYAHYPDGAGRSKLTIGAIESALGVTATARNMKTALRLTSL